MPKGAQTYSKGGQRRTIICCECDRQFCGTIKMVNKLINLHMKKEHGRTDLVEPPSSYSSTAMKVNKNMNWGTPLTIDESNYITITGTLDDE